MLNIFKHIFSRYQLSSSLKRKLVTVLMFSSLIPLVLIGAISFYSILSLLKNDVENGIRSNLKQVRSGLENTMNILDNASRQLALDGSTANKLAAYMDSDDVMLKYKLGKEINEVISLMGNANSNLGAITYFFTKSNEAMFNNFKIREEFKLQGLSNLISERGIMYLGPNPSANPSRSSDVLAIARKVDSFVQEDCYVYIETGYRVFEKLISTEQYTLEVQHLMLNEKGEIVYSSTEKDFPAGTLPDIDLAQTERQSVGEYYLFNEASSQRWNIVAAVKSRDYNRVVNEWFTRFFLLGGLSLLISFLFAIALWNLVYKPLRNINREIELMSQSKFNSEIRFTGVQEFDHLLERFGFMRDRVVGLLTEVEQKERMKRHLEVEKLLHQINPHFLHNTLNTIQWLARTNGQTEIARLVALFTKVLHYNLGKEGGIVTLGEEVEALRSYIDLQRIRYDYQFQVDVSVAEDTLEAKVPRFILQPLVENALYHGLADEGGRIGVEVTREEDFLYIRVSDNGAGMNTAEIQKLMNDENGEHKKVGLGIGMSYVDKMLKVHYSGNGAMDIKSEVGAGTVITLKVPCRVGILPEEKE